MADQPSTTAARLIAYRNELIEGDVPDRLADDLVRQASASLLDSGLPFLVKVVEPPPLGIADQVADAARAAAVELFDALGIKL